MFTESITVYMFACLFVRLFVQHYFENNTEVIDICYKHLLSCYLSVLLVFLMAQRIKTSKGPRETKGEYMGFSEHDAILT